MGVCAGSDPQEWLRQCTVQVEKQGNCSGGPEQDTRSLPTLCEAKEDFHTGQENTVNNFTSYADH